MADDVRYRLSAEGIAEIKLAFRELLAEAQRSGAGTRKSFQGVNGILDQMKGKLAALGVAGAAAAFVNFARSGAVAADTLEENAAAAGTTTRSYTALAAAAELNGSSADAMTTALGKLANTVQDAREGSAGAIETLGKLGLTVRDFEGKDTAEAMELIARAVTAIPDPIERGAAAIDVFGRSGARLIPVLRELAENGLAGVEDAGRRVGVVLDDETVAAAARAADELDVMRQRAGALAIVLAAELAPAVHDTFTLLAEDTEESRRAMEITGKTFGTVWRYIVALVVDFIDGISTAAKLLVGGLAVAIGGLFATVVLAAQGEFGKIPKLWETLLGQLTKITEDFNQRHTLRVNVLQGKSFGDVETGGSSTAAPKQKGRVTPAGDGKKEFASRIAAEKAMLDAENRLLELNLKAQSDTEKARFADGLVSLREYFERRRAILQAGVAADIRALEAERDAQAANPDRAAARTAVAGIDRQIELRRRQGQVDEAGLGREELEAAQKLFDQRVGFEERLAEVQGRRHEAEIAGIEREAQALQLLLDQEGALSEDDQFAQVNTFRQTLLAGAEFKRQLDAFQGSLDQLSAERAAIEADVAQGQLSQIEGANQILALEKSRIPELERIAALTLQAANATGDPAKIQQALDLATAIDGLAVQVTETQLRMANLGQEVGDILGSSIADGLSASGDAFETFGDRALSVLASIIEGVRRLAAEILAQQAVRALFGLFSSGIPQTSIAPNPGVPGFAFGGLVHGVGTGRSDSNLARISRGEFVVRQAIVSRPGMLSHLENLNAGMAPVFPRFDALKVPRFADGGLVGGGGQTTLGGQVTVGLEDGLVERALETRAGTRALLRVVQKNPSAFKHALGRNR